MRVLAGDIGGTKTSLAIADVEPGRVAVRCEATYASAEHADFAPLVRGFLERAGTAHDGIEAAGFGVAGPVVGGRARVTKLPWTIDAARLVRDLRIARVRLVNDFEALAHALSMLGPADLAPIKPGRRDPEGPIALLGAGTGLGEAIVLRAPGFRVVPGEGGHADFAPRDDVEVELWRWMAARHGHVSWDRVLSGPGLGEIYAFLRDTRRGTESAALRDKLAAARDAAPVVTTGARDGDPLCGAAVRMFVAAYGAEAGNLALRAVATGGVVLGGGIAPRLLDELRSEPFRAAFAAKGRLAGFLEDVAVDVIVHPNAGLVGAAAAALAGGDA